MAFWILSEGGQTLKNDLIKNTIEFAESVTRYEVLLNAYSS